MFFNDSRDANICFGDRPTRAQEKIIDFFISKRANM